MAKEIVVGIDTSTDCCLVALGCQGELLEESSLLAPRAHQKVLLSELSRLLKKSNSTVQDLNLILIGQGPGSYTGLRVGFATVRALSQALNVPIYTFPSFDVIAAPFFPRAKEVLVAMDAKRNQVYLSLYVLDELISPVIPPSIFALKEAKNLIEKHLETAFLVGNAFKNYPELSMGKEAEVRDCFPIGKWLLKLGWEGFLKKGATPLEEVLPLYLRLSTAEESLLGKQ